MSGTVLNDAQIESLVITHADYFERELRPLLGDALNGELDAYLARAGNVYADQPCVNPPTAEEAKAILSRIYVALAEGLPEKAKLGQIMRENGLSEELQVPSAASKQVRG